MAATMMVCPRCWGRREDNCDKCENQGRISNVWFTKNFMLGELLGSQTAREKRIPNDPTAKELDHLLALTRNLLQPLRADIGAIKVTSGFRSARLNRALPGSSKTSAHMVGYAADIQPRECTLEEVMLWFQRTKLPFDQAILELVGKSHWVHVGYKHPSSGAQRRQLLVNRDGKYSDWTP